MLEHEPDTLVRENAGQHEHPLRKALADVPSRINGLRYVTTTGARRRWRRHDLLRWAAA